MRKAYLKLSLLIHPDKLGNSYPEAKAAFQSLVRAFESLSSPPVETDTQAKAKAGKHKQLKRSNEVTVDFDKDVTVFLTEIGTSKRCHVVNAWM